MTTTMRINQLQAASQTILRREFLRLREVTVQAKTRKYAKDPSGKALIELYRHSNRYEIRRGSRETYVLWRGTCARCSVERFHVTPWKSHAHGHVWRCDACTAAIAEEKRKVARETIAAKRAVARGPIKQRKCSQCGDRFLPKTAAQRSSYCSSPCRQAAYRARVTSST